MARPRMATRPHGEAPPPWSAGGGQTALLSVSTKEPPGDLLRPCSVMCVTAECRVDEHAVIEALRPCFAPTRLHYGA